MGYKSSLVAIRQLDRHGEHEEEEEDRKWMCAILSFSLRGLFPCGLELSLPPDASIRRMQNSVLKKMGNQIRSHLGILYQTQMSKKDQS